MQLDMTKGTPLIQILKFTIPIFIGNFIQQFYVMADTVIVGRTLGANALAAVGASGSSNFLILSFFWGICGGVVVITAQRFGAKDPIGIKRSIAACFSIAGVSAVIYTAIFLIFCKRMLIWMNTPEEIFHECYLYTVWTVAGGIAATAFSCLIYNLLRSLGDSRTPLVALIISAILNILFDLLFILVFHWGVAGAAIASVVAQILTAWLCYLYALRHFKEFRLTKRDWHFNFRFYWAHLRVALPMAVQYTIIGFGIVVMQTVMNRFGPVVLTAVTAAVRIQMCISAPACALGAAMATYTAQNYGARRLDRIRLGVRQTSICCILLGLVFMVLLQVFCRPLTSLFLDHPTEEVFALSKLYIRITSSFYVPFSLIMIFRLTLQSIGYAYVSLLAGIMELLGRCIGAPLLADWFGFAGVSFSDPLAWVGSDILLIPFYFYAVKEISRKWNQRQK